MATNKIRLVVIRRVLVLTVLIMLLQINTVGGDGWSDCPSTITSYVGCSVRVHASFYPLDYDAINCFQGEDFKFTICLSLKSTDANSSVVKTVEYTANVTDNQMNSSCNVYADMINVNESMIGTHDLTFIAWTVGSNPKSKLCVDHLIVEDPSPDVNSITVTCDGVLVEWTAPLLVATDVSGYTVYVPGTTIKYTTDNTTTSLLVPYHGLEWNQVYNISLFATYCGGHHGTTTTKTFTTAISPQVDSSIRNYFIDSHNESHVALTIIAKISAKDCIVSYPQMYSTNVTCNGHLLSMEHGTRPVAADGTIGIVEHIPIDSVCSSQLMFTYGPWTVSREISTNTNQLKSCLIINNNKEIHFVCKFSSFSSLWGCRGVAVHDSSNSSTVVDITANSRHGRIPVVYNGLYTVSCYGLANSTLSTINYDGSLHNSIINMTGGTDCNEISSSACTGTTPTGLERSDKPNTGLYIGIISSLSSLLILIVIIKIILAIAKWRKKHCGHGYTQQKDEEVLSMKPQQ